MTFYIFYIFTLTVFLYAVVNTVGGYFFFFLFDGEIKFVFAIFYCISLFLSRSIRTGIGIRDTCPGSAGKSWQVQWAFFILFFNITAGCTREDTCNYSVHYPRFDCTKKTQFPAVANARWLYSKRVCIEIKQKKKKTVLLVVFNNL